MSTESKLYVFTGELPSTSYEPCSSFAEVKLDVQPGAPPVAAMVRLVKTGTTPGGRDRMHLVIEPAAPSIAATPTYTKE